ncbi:MAG: 2-oxoisovalerate dehydrogenase [Clostridia bacterium]|nr:2-oxoisovalerate dehydrogenase [Clostridia bacterium]
MDQEIIFLIEEAPEGGYTARSLGYSIFTEGENLDEIRSNVRDAVRCHFEDKDMPRVIRLHIVKDEVMAV